MMGVYTLAHMSVIEHKLFFGHSNPCDTQLKTQQYFWIADKQADK